RWREKNRCSGSVFSWSERLQMRWEEFLPHAHQQIRPQEQGDAAEGGKADGQRHLPGGFAVAFARKWAEKGAVDDGQQISGAEQGADDNHPQRKIMLGGEDALEHVPFA